MAITVALTPPIVERAFQSLYQCVAPTRQGGRREAACESGERREQRGGSKEGGSLAGSYSKAVDPLGTASPNGFKGLDAHLGDWNRGSANRNGQARNL
jgi:hypothetical protein